MKMNSPVMGLAAFKNLKQLVYGHSGKLSDSLLYYLLQMMTVFFFLENAKGYSDMNKDVFENYKILLEKDLLNYKI